jgi:hypothetical protein
MTTGYARVSGAGRGILPITETRKQTNDVRAAKHFLDADARCELDPKASRATVVRIRAVPL